MHYCLMRAKDNRVKVATKFNPDRDDRRLDQLAKRYGPGTVLGQGDTADDAMDAALNLAAGARVSRRLEALDTPSEEG